MTTTTADGWTDFNDIQDGNRATVALRHCNTYPVVGARFTLGDGEGNWCVGHVEALHERFAHVRLDLTTWHDGPR